MAEQSICCSWPPRTIRDVLGIVQACCGFDRDSLGPLMPRTQHVNVARPFDPAKTDDVEGAAAREAAPEAAAPAAAKRVTRTAAEHAALVDALQAELLADDLHPPESSIAWTEGSLRCWFEDGGAVTLRALACDSVNALNLDSELSTAPRRRLGLLSVADDHLLGAMHRRDADAFARVAAQFGAVGWAACRLGLPSQLWQLAREEGARAWPLMRPNHITRSSDGQLIPGRSPSGAVRGDRYIVAHTLPGGAESYPMLCALDALMVGIGGALAPAIAADASCGGVELIGGSHAQVAIFPGNGAEYGAHFDGDGLTTRMTMIVYTSAGWTPADGGELCVYDERANCWHELPPHEDTILFFRSEKVLHKVRPSHAPQRLALTAFFTAARTAELLKDARDPGRHGAAEGVAD